MTTENAHAKKIQKIVILGAGYAGLHVAQRLSAWAGSRFDELKITLVDKNPYHQVLTELPLVAAGTRAAQAVRVPVEPLFGERVNFVQTRVGDFDLANKALLTESGPLPYDRLVIAAGSQPNDFGIPGLSERALTLWSVDDARRILAALDSEIAAAVHADEMDERRRHLTVAVGGGGATGIELAGELAEVLPELLQRHDLPINEWRVVLVEAAPTLLTGSSQGLIERATKILGDLKVEIRSNSPIAQATEEGFVLKSGEVIRAGLCVWCGGVKAASVVAQSPLGTGPGGRVPVDEYLRVVEHPEIYVAGDAALLINHETGRPYPPLAQIALEEGETVAKNLYAEIAGEPLEKFVYRDKGFVISVGSQQGVAAVLGRDISGRLVRVLKEAIEWEYRQSVKHLQGWSPL